MFKRGQTHGFDSLIIDRRTWENLHQYESRVELRKWTKKPDEQRIVGDSQQISKKLFDGDDCLVAAGEASDFQIGKL